MNRLVIGDLSAPLVSFTGDDIEAVSGHTQVDVSGSALSIDTLETPVWHRFIASCLYQSRDGACILTADGYLYATRGEGSNLARDIPRGTPIYYYHGERLMGRYYVDLIHRRLEAGGCERWDISALSLIGLFEQVEHPGGLYKGESFASLAASIFDASLSADSSGNYLLTGGAEDCIIDKALGDQSCYGWLPYQSRRENLHQLLIAFGGSIYRDPERILHMGFLDMSQPEFISSDDLYLGGSVSYDPEATGVELKEHAFQWDYKAQPQDIFNNSDAYSAPADYTLVKFSAPVMPGTLASVGGITIHESSVNHMVISGKGFVRGTPYKHIMRSLKRELPYYAGPRKLRMLNDAYLINALNSEFALERIYRICTGAYTHSAELNLQGQITGRAYRFSSENEPVSGIMTQSEWISDHAIVRAACEFVSNFAPGPFGNNFNKLALVTGSGFWTVPETVRSSDFPYVRISLVAGGQGGAGGAGGAQGRGVYTGANGEFIGYGGGAGGKAGKGGAGGSGGKVLVIPKVDVRNVAVIEFSCGAAGTAGSKGFGGYAAVDPVPPGAGGAGGETFVRLIDDAGSVVAEFSTAAGYQLGEGVLNIFNDEIYGLDGIAGISGGDGGEGGAAAFGAIGKAGAPVSFGGTEYPGGEGSMCEFDRIEQTQLVAYCGGGGGGGAAVGAAGENALTPGAAEKYLYCYGGNAGRGASAAISPQSPVAYGQGGDGGHGGGGGGTGGAQNWRATEATFDTGIRDGFMGHGGDGSAGAQGAPGCGFIYYGLGGETA